MKIYGVLVCFREKYLKVTLVISESSGIGEKLQILGIISNLPYGGGIMTV